VRVRVTEGANRQELGDYRGIKRDEGVAKIQALPKGVFLPDSGT